MTQSPRPKSTTTQALGTGFADALARRYWIVLAGVAVLIVANQVLVQPALMRMMTDAPLINVAGRQRMLSQRLCKAALASDRAPGAEGIASREELAEVLALWTAAHDRLRSGESGSRWIIRPGAEARADLTRIETSFERMRISAFQLLDSGGDEAGARQSLAVLLDHEGAYLDGMDRVVSLFEHDARQRVNRLRWVSWGMTLFTLLALGAVGRLLLWPAVVLIRRQVAELSRARDELEARVIERTKELEQAQERQRELMAQLSHVGRTHTIGEMASGLAHELNQPLGSIANYAEGCLVALKAPDPPIDEISQALDRLLAATMRAGRIIDRIRRFVTRQESHREPLDPERLAQETVELLKDDAARRSVDLRRETARGLPPVWGDPVAILQVLVNLIRNALEALESTQTQQKSILLWIRPADNGGVEFGLTDTGPGIPQDRIDRIFDAYFSTSAGGMGMGLAICRTIVEAHGARLRVESEPGTQTTFHFVLPSDEGE